MTANFVYASAGLRTSAQSRLLRWTDYQGGTVSAGSRLYVGIDAGRRQYVVAAIALERMENGSWERAAVHRIPTTGQGSRKLLTWSRSNHRARPFRPSQVARSCWHRSGVGVETSYVRTIGHADSH